MENDKIYAGDRVADYVSSRSINTRESKSSAKTDESIESEGDESYLNLHLEVVIEQISSKTIFKLRNST